MIRAIRYPKRDTWIADGVPGSYWIDHREDNGVRLFWFYCPCGCGARGRIHIGEEFKPDWSPSWEWNGSWTDPSLSPSVDQMQCGWHGWLSGGYWEAAG